jgi:hypothetical protein
MTNSWNSQVWSPDDSHTSTETHFQSCSSVDIWCGVIRSQVIRPFVLEECLTSERYLRLLGDELPVLLDVAPHIRRELWLLQDGAPPPHSGRQVTAFFKQHFQNRRIGRQSQFVWPPRSPDLTPLDYCLWGRMKSLVYAVNSRTGGEFFNRIMDASVRIRKDKPSLTRSVTSVSRNVTMCINNHGSHLEQLLRYHKH